MFEVQKCVLCGGTTIGATIHDFRMDTSKAIDWTVCPNHLRSIVIHTLTEDEVDRLHVFAGGTTFFTHEDFYDARKFKFKLNTVTVSKMETENNTDMTQWPTIENQFTYHKPFGNQPARYEQLRYEARQLAFAIVKHCPASTECDYALKALRESIMWANASIACNEKESS